MPTELARLRKEYLVAFAERLAPLGFKRSGDRYYRVTGYGKDVIDAYFVSHPRFDFVITLSVGIRYEAVEKTMAEFLTYADAATLRQITTIGNRVPNMMRSSYDDWHWTVTNELDMLEAIEKSMGAVQTVALPYFERFSSLEAALDLLTRGYAESGRYNMWWEPTVAMVAVTIAFLLGDRAVFDRVLAQQMEILASERVQHNVNMAGLLPYAQRLFEALSERWDSHG